MIDSLNQSITQADFARLVGRSEGRVSQWAADGTLKPGAPALAWLQALVDRLSSEAAGRASDGPLDLSQERAALAREQRIGQEMKNATLRGEFAPIALLSQVLATASQAVVDRLDQLPSRLRKSCPTMSEAARATIMVTISEARNEWVRQTMELVAARIVEGDDDEASDAATDDDLAAT